MGEDIKLICHDCQRELRGGDEYMTYYNVDFIKCKDCHIKDPIMRNYQECEVFSRVVGYIRPVKNWNKGKAEEFKDRVVFKADRCSCE